MTLTHLTKPSIKIRVDPAAADDEVQDYFHSGSITLRENAVPVAELYFADTDNTLYDNIIAFNDIIAVYLNYEEAADPLTKTDLRFYGFVEDMTPVLTSQGELLHLRLRHYGRCLLDLTVGQEYGSKSNNSGLDELHEILDDNAVGIIDNYVVQVNNDFASGYAVDDTLILPDTDAIKFVSFPYTPVKNALDSLIDIYGAIKAEDNDETFPGYHWIPHTVEDPADTFTTYLIVDRMPDGTNVTTHSTAAPNINSVWPTWWNETEALSTITVKADMLTQAFTKRRAEANYILYYGKLAKPGGMDLWTENNSGLWGVLDHTIVSDEAGAGNFLVDSFSLKMAHTADATPANSAFYPAARDASWNIESWGGKYNIPTVSFWIKSSATDEADSTFKMGLHTGGGIGDSFDRRISPIITAANRWYHFSYPMGPYSAQEINGSGLDVWDVHNVPDWADIDSIAFTVATTGDGQTVNWYVDGLHFSGWVARGAKKAAEPYYKQKIITDDVGKDDSGIAGDASYLMAQLAYAQLLRSSRRPIQGQIAVPMKPSILPGSKAPIEAAAYDGGYRIDKAMRIIEHRMSFTNTGAVSYLSLTDDLINSRPIPLVSAYNMMLHAAHPEYQTRQIASIKAKTIDITQPILQKTYTFDDYF